MLSCPALLRARTLSYKEWWSACHQESSCPHHWRAFDRVGSDPMSPHFPHRSRLQLLVLRELLRRFQHLGQILRESLQAHRKCHRVHPAHSCRQTGKCVSDKQMTQTHIQTEQKAPTRHHHRSQTS